MPATPKEGVITAFEIIKEKIAAPIEMCLRDNPRTDGTVELHSRKADADGA